MGEAGSEMGIESKSGEIDTNINWFIIQSFPPLFLFLSDSVTTNSFWNFQGFCMLFSHYISNL